MVAKKRMFSMKIIDTDAFLDMPLSTQALYFHLNMRADDDGFVGNPKRIQRLIGASDDDLKLLIAKRFALCFENGVIVIKHWRIHNTIKSDRYTQTTYIDEKNTLKLKENKAYTEADLCLEQSGTKMVPKCFQNGTAGLGLDLGLDLDIDKEILMSEPEQVQFIQLPLNTGDLYPIYENDVTEWMNIYPNVDVKQQLRNMLGWLNSNPTRRKTKAGIKRFINGWLSKEQDKPRYNNPRSEIKPEWLEKSEKEQQTIEEDIELKKRALKLQLECGAISQSDFDNQMKAIDPKYTSQEDFEKMLEELKNGAL